MRTTRRWPFLAIATLLLGVLVPRGADAQTPSGLSKADGPLRAIVERNLTDSIYTNVVQGHVPGTVYYLAHLRSVDAVTLQQLRLAGATVRYRFDLINTVALASPNAAVARVNALSGVTKLEADKVLHLLTATTTAISAADYGDQSKRGTHDIGADEAWVDGIFGESVTVGVVDSGIDGVHDDLINKVDYFVDCQAVAPGVFVGDPNIGSCVPNLVGHDDNGHGSHVSGMIAGDATDSIAGKYDVKLPGMAPAARLVGAKACNAGGVCLNSSVMAGIQQLALPKGDPFNGGGANVINISLGGAPGYAAGVFGANQETDADSEAQLIDALADKFNVVFSIAAGNAGPTLQSVGSPSTASQGLSVGASVADWDLNHPREETLHGLNGNVNPDAAAKGKSAISTFSSRGPSGDRQVKPDLTAPGSYFVSVEDTAPGEVKAADAAIGHNYSTDLSYAVLSGTSMAAPAAAGSAALVIDGYHQATGSVPKYYVVKAAMVNTAHGQAFEGPITGLISSIKSARAGMDPGDLFPKRNDAEVGVTGTGAGRVYVPDALIAATSGVVAYTPEARNVNGFLTVDALQPSWGLDDLTPGQRSTQKFVLQGGPNMVAPKAKLTFAIESGPEANGINAAPASWFSLPSSASVSRGSLSSFTASVKPDAKAASGQYTATIVATASIGNGVTQKIRIPVQFFVPVNVDQDLTGPIWANDATDYSIVGLENPEAQIYTDWEMVPFRVPNDGTKSVTFNVWDAVTDSQPDAAAATMDVFVFNGAGDEIGSTVNEPSHAVPGAVALSPTSAASPGTVTLDVVTDPAAVSLVSEGFSNGTLLAGDVVWLVLSNTKPVGVAPGMALSAPVPFATYHLKITKS